MSSLEVSIPFWGNIVVQDSNDTFVEYPIRFDGETKGIHQLCLRLLPPNPVLGSVLEIRSKFEDKELLPKEEQATPLSLEEQLSKLPFKEQNALYKLMNTWGCRMER